MFHEASFPASVLRNKGGEECLTFSLEEGENNVDFVAIYTQHYRPWMASHHSIERHAEDWYDCTNE